MPLKAIAIKSYYHYDDIIAFDVTNMLLSIKKIIPHEDIGNCMIYQKDEKIIIHNNLPHKILSCIDLNNEQNNTNSLDYN